MRTRQRTKNIDWLLAQDALIDRALRRAVRKAVRQHWAAGYPVAEWRNDRVVWIAPDGTVRETPSRARRR